jgi:hypothetical protein
MGSTKQIPRDDWKQYFEELDRRHLEDDSATATIELLSEELGAEPEATRAHLIGLDYDAKDNALEVALDGLDHLVFEPVEIWVVEEDDGFVSALEVKQPDGSKEIMRIERIGADASPTLSG